MYNLRQPRKDQQADLMKRTHYSAAYRPALLPAFFSAALQRKPGLILKL